MFEPRDYQEDLSDQGAMILWEHNIFMLVAQMRIGKTIIGLMAAEKFGATNVLFVTRKKAISSIQNDYKLLNPDFELTVINYESVHKVPKIAFDLVVADEFHNCSAFPKPSLRAKRLKERVGKTSMIMLSGSPSPESFSQLYHPLWVSDYSPWSRYRNFYAWAKDYVSVYTKDIAGRPKKFYDRADKERILSDIEPFMVSFTQEQAGFTSMVEEEVLTVRMPDNIRQAYHQMNKDRLVKFHDCEVPASNKADIINKLSQLCGGTIKVDDSYTKVLSTYKAKYIKDNFDQGKISIFYKYQAEKLILEKVFPDCTDDPEVFNTTDVRYFIGQIQSVRKGVNLKESDCIVMYNIDFSATSYIQAKARLQTKDRVKASKVYWLFTEGGIETYVYKAVRAKRNFTSRFYATQIKPQYA